MNNLNDEDIAFEFSNEEEAVFLRGNYDAPQATEYEQSYLTALTQTFNTAAALYNRGAYIGRGLKADPETYDNQPFDRSLVGDWLTNQGYDDEIRYQVMQRHFTSWDEAYAAAEHVKDVMQKEAQVAEKGLATNLAFGLPIALFDIDTALYGPVLGVAGKAGKTFNILQNGTKAAKVGKHVLTGGTVGAISMAGYEVASGVEHENAIMNAALFGMGLGGTLGYFVEKGTKNPNLVSHVDKDGKPIKSKEEIITAEREALNKEQRELDDLIEESAALEKEAKETGVAYHEERGRDVGRVRFDNKLKAKTLNQEKNALKDIWKTASKTAEAASTAVTSIAKQIRELSSGLTKAEENSNTVFKIAEEKKGYVRQTVSVRGQVTKLKNQMEKLKGRRDKEARQLRKALREKLEAQSAKLDSLNSKIQEQNNKLAQIEGDPNKFLKENSGRLTQLRADHFKAEQSHAAAVEERNTSRQTFSDAVKAEREHKIGANRNTVGEGEVAKALRLRKEGIEYRLSGEGLRAALEKRGLLSADLAKLDNGDLNLSALRATRRENKNALLKLDEELQKLQKAEDFRLTSDFKQHPQWMQKLLISPIQNLLGSKSGDGKVAGFASWLHPGTIHNGKVQKHTVWGIKELFNADLSKTLKGVQYLYHQAVEKGAFAGKLEAFEALVNRNIHDVNAALEREIDDIPATVQSTERFERASKNAASAQRVHKTDNDFVKQASDLVLDYYERIHAAGVKYDIPAFTGSIGKGYAKRVYSAQKFTELGEANVKSMLYEAMKKKAAFKGIAETPALEKEWKEIADSTWTNVTTGQYHKQQLSNFSFKPLRANASSLRERTIDAFSDDLHPLLEDNMRSTLALYSHQTHGRLAFARVTGTATDKELDDLVLTLGANPKELENLKVVIDTLRGTREMSSDMFNPLTRALKAVSTFSSAMHTMAFGVPTMTEIASVAKEFGWSRTVERFWGAPKEIVSMYRHGTPSDKNAFEMMISYGDAVFANKANRYDIETNFDSVGRLQEFGDGVVRRMSIWGGLMPITDMLRLTTASLSVDFLARMSVAKKISKTDEMRLQDMGWGKEDLPRIRDTLKVTPDGRIGNTDRKTWGKLDEDISLSVNIMVDRTILHPNGATLPKFMTDMNSGQFVPRVMMKFMRFPFESYERLLIRGIQESDAKQLTALAGNVAMWAGILSIKDALRDEDKQMYQDDEGMTKLFRDSMMYNSWTSLPVATGDWATGLTTGKTLMGYPHRLGGAVQSDIESAQKGNFRFALPFYSFNVGEAFSDGMTQLMGLEETNK